MGYFHKRYHPPGTPPGTLAERPAEPRDEAVPLRMRLVDYTESDYQEHELQSADEGRAFLDGDSVTWIHVEGHAEPETLRQLGETFGLHPLALEDVNNSGQRPKSEWYGDQLFVVMGLPVEEERWVRLEQVSLFVAGNRLISFHDGAGDPFAPVRQRLSRASGKLRARGSDYLLYALLDLVVDQGFPLLESFGVEAELLEDEVMERPSRKTVARIHAFKRELLLVRRVMWPQREVINSLLRDGDGVIEEETRVYLRDVYDHTVQILDLLETYRDMATGMMDVYLSSVSNRLNEIMRVLTVISTIFIPLTFITGLYGMNFGSRGHPSPWAMPELDWYYGYPLVLLVMAVVVAGMLWLFRRKGWL